MSPRRLTPEEPTAPEGTSEFRPTLITVGEVLSRAWAIFKVQALWCILGVVGFYAATFAFLLPAYGLFFALVGGRQNNVPPNNPQLPAVGIVFMVAIGLVWLFVGTWLMLGLQAFLLKIARGQPAGIGDFRSVGPHVLSAVGALILTQLAVMVGFALLIVPGIIIGIMLSQAPLVIVDRGVGTIDSLRLSVRATEGNKLTLLGLWLVLVVMAIPVQFCTCGLGMIAFFPFTMLAHCVAYLMMTGQRTADQLPATLPV